MAVPSSGALSLASIRGELENNSYAAYTSAATSLEEASTGDYGTINTANAAADRPDQVTPHAMSEFYAYDHDVSSGWAAYTLVYKSGKYRGVMADELPREYLVKTTDGYYAVDYSKVDVPFEKIN